MSEARSWLDRVVAAASAQHTGSPCGCSSAAWSGLGWPRASLLVSVYVCGCGNGASAGHHHRR
eukprot:2515135-Rhodomonas_salina.1